jgi:hypothetical protein
MYDKFYTVTYGKPPYPHAPTCIILPVMYGCETWSLTLRDELRLRVFENRVLRGIFGPKRDEVMRLEKTA